MTISSIFTTTLQQAIEKSYDEALPLFGCRRKKIEQAVQGCTGLKKLLLQFLYGAMPLSDAANYEPQLFLSYVNHGIFLLENVPWCAQLPAAVFLNEVLFHRVNSEEITDCRPIFYQQVQPVVQGKSMEQAVLDLNYWCLQNATYRLTDDRTASPLTVLRCAYGRCGEESTFTVTALRSVGVPARQVYAPKWGHCDDNHAWVEVWCNGQWRYLGACEPEEVLDKGWFTAAASRAMLVHSRTFGAHGVLAEEGEEKISQEGAVVYWNQLLRYADVTPLVITVIENEEPVANACISVQLLNYSAFSPIAALQTGADGTAYLTVGYGDLYLHIEKNGRFMCQKVDTRSNGTVAVDFALARPVQQVGRGSCAESELDMVPPKDSMRFWTSLPQEVIQRHQQRFDEAAAQRQKKENSFATAEQGEKQLLQWGYPEAFAQAGGRHIEQARGNADELLSFLYRGTNADRQYRVQLLDSLTLKDDTDLRADILDEALAYTMQYKDKIPEQLLVPYVMCPRVSLEVLQPWHGRLAQYWSRQEREEFCMDPSKLWQWIQEHIADETEHEYDQLITAPIGLMEVGRGTPHSKQVLFVAVSRALGIPARLCTEDGSPQYWNGEAFISPLEERQQKCAHFILTTEEEEPWEYGQNWSLARVQQGQYLTLNFSNLQWNNRKLNLTLESGEYRLITCKRVPTGALFAKQYLFDVAAGEERSICIAARRVRFGDLLENREIPDFVLRVANGSDVKASQLVGEKNNILLWLEEGKEPTEHILNEMLEQSDAFTQANGQIIFVLRTKQALENKKVRLVLEKIPGIIVCFDDFRDNLSALARRMYVDAEKLPFVVLTKPGLTGVYASSGYNVGMGSLLLKMLAE